MGSPSHVSHDSSDPCLAVVAKISELYQLRDTFYPEKEADKKAKLDSGVKEVLLMIETLANETAVSSKRGHVAYLRGKALDVGPDFSKEAEEQLSKAVKLDPSLADAWACLGHSFWKKGDLSQAQNCFKAALKKGPHKEALQQLSMLERSLAKADPEAAQQLVEASLGHAREAVALDIRDGRSWYTLGNAFLTHYFATGAWDFGQLRQALKAYQNAERDAAAACNPDLHFNRATVHSYLGEYSDALRDFAAAAERDPSLNAEAEVQKIVKLAGRLADLVANKGRVKAKKLAGALAELGAAAGPSSHRVAPLGSLSPGVNKGVALLAKVLVQAASDSTYPLTYILVDKDGSCCVLAVYAVREGAVKADATVSLLDPVFSQQEVRWQDKVYSFPLIRVDHVQQVLVDGKPLKQADAVRSTLYTANKAS
ncbi:hypothetical protein KFL_002220160 [Klebsormidium nitens]|uniref:Tetratricopeptide repeat protein 5 OB fold domain-containing protein n=1 Tax=Klebsormidium nitens TaxID=105231 RepID=A0A1Y1I5E2_KLENI|nr:hypothetical protein KFL_002220160 [Klebsormidium nitens]|eukprot:GAQ85172.1 hypothetical protein KFL_002220160 [Klebsormidium nitens]